MWHDVCAALAAHARQPAGRAHRLLTGRDEPDDDLSPEQQRIAAQREREALRRERIRARTVEWLQQTGGVGVPPAGSRVEVVSGAYQGQRGVVVRLSGNQVRVRLDDGREVRPLRLSVRIEGAA